MNGRRVARIAIAYIAGFAFGRLVIKPVLDRVLPES